ncbi:AAA family ATPase [Halomarina salina]|uniref:AAA family ATPase n=1 Tax=Halomarina salina TaxID=1872699 RepID=A0ABD5RRU8_9EURY|nr:MoxR family ATPase [Halomarina salina]
MSARDPESLYNALRKEMGTVLIGKDDVVEGLTIALLTRGHVLLEGVPGVAKTTIANLFARTTGLQYTRIQMTPDVLPADVVGTTVYRESTSEFELRKGPIFANVVVADEINRATPKTQSALLEAMAERNATIDGETLSLPDPFVVVATQNPIEMEGTFELPEAQRDRFLFQLDVSLPTRDEERELLNEFDRAPTLGPDAVERVVTPNDLLEAREMVESVHAAPELKEYILDIVGASRDTADTRHGGSPRASLAFLNAGKARAAIHGREYVIPDDVKALAQSVLAHRLVLSTDAELSDLSAREVVDEIVGSVEPPGSDTEAVESVPVSDGGDASEQ